MLEPARDETMTEAAPRAAPGPYIPAALEDAFNTLAAAGLLPSQMKLVGEILDRALDEIFGHVAANYPNDLGPVLRHFYHLKSEPTAPVRSLLGGE